MSKQLTKEIRAEIVARVIRKTFSQREEELKKAVTAFADQAYEALIPEQFLSVAGSLPADYFIQTAGVMFSHRIERKGQSEQIIILYNPTRLLDHKTASVRRHEKDYAMSRKRPFPYFLANTFCHCGDFIIRHQAGASAIVAEHGRLEKVAGAIADEKKAMEERLNGFLASVRTFKALIDTAPELKPFIPADAMEVRAPMPAPVVGTLITDLMKAGLKLQTVEA